MDEPSPKLMDVIFLALDHGIESVKSSGGPLIPFVVTEGSERKLDVFVLEQLEEALANFALFVSSWLIFRRSGIISVPSPLP
jgi:hypothetical protein